LLIADLSTFYISILMSTYFITTSQSTISNQQSAISNPVQSEIGNRQ